MAIELMGGNFTLFRSYLSSGLSLNKYVSRLTEQKKTIFSTGSSYFDDFLFNKLGDVSSNAIDIQPLIGKMASFTQYLSSVRDVAYSDEDVLSASVANNATVSRHTTTTNVDVTQLASGQQNRSDDLGADENSFGDQFKIGITNSAGNIRKFSVRMTEQDNNKTAMQAMANKINAYNIGIRAALAEDKENGTVSLLLSGENTGEVDGKFTVTDESAANLGNVVSMSQDAKYSVNGREFSSQSNEVEIMDGVTVTLNKTGSTQITYVEDFSRAIGDVQKFLDTFNNLLDASSNSPLKEQLANLMDSSGRGLGSSGIDIDSNGKLSIDDPDKLRESISNGSFARNFQGMNSFGDKLYDVSLSAQSTVYNAAIQDRFNGIVISQINNSGSVYGDWGTSSSFYPGLIFSIWV